MRRAVLLIALLPLYARDKAVDYPVHASLPGLEIGAEYLEHSVPGDKGFYIVTDFLVVDVGVFPSTPEGVNVKTGQFSLRINRDKRVLAPVSARTVAAALKYPDLESQRGAAGQQQSASAMGKFPGDPDAPPPIVPANAPPDPSGIEKQIPTSMDESIASAALPDGLTHKAAKGCVFFRYRGKMKAIKSLELIYDPGEGRPKVTISLL